MNMKKFLGIFAIALLGGAAAMGLQQLFHEEEQPKSLVEKNNVYFTKNQAESLLPAFDFVDVAERTTPAVVHITTTMEVKTSQQTPNADNPWGEFFDERFFRQMPQGPRQATGSGVIITEDGYIATNNHVIDNASSITVVLEDKRKYEAELIGSDPETDLALLKIKEKDLAFLPFGNSDDIKVGEWVVAVGNPFNLNSTVTAGIVSAKGRNINLLSRNSQYAIENFIQTDAVVNPGNSGGALVNTRGELIGINTAIASQTGSYAGYSFAVPVNIAKKILDDILKYGEVKRAMLGVQIRDITSDLAKEKGIDEIKGVLVPSVVEGGAAEKAGIKDDDVILAIDGQEVNKASELQELISKYHPGDKVEVEINRGGKTMTKTAMLLSKQGESTIVASTDRAKIRALGAEFENLSREEKKKANVAYGVRIGKVGAGPLRAKNVPQGFIITHVDKRKVTNTKDLSSALKNKKGSILIDGVNSSGEEDSFAVRVEG